MEKLRQKGQFLGHIHKTSHQQSRGQAPQHWQCGTSSLWGWPDKGHHYFLNLVFWRYFQCTVQRCESGVPGSVLLGRSAARAVLPSIQQEDALAQAPTHHTFFSSTSDVISVYCQCQEPHLQSPSPWMPPTSCLYPTASQHLLPPQPPSSPTPPPRILHNSFLYPPCPDPSRWVPHAPFPVIPFLHSHLPSSPILPGSPTAPSLTTLCFDSSPLDPPYLFFTSATPHPVYCSSPLDPTQPPPPSLS